MTPKPSDKHYTNHSWPHEKKLHEKLAQYKEKLEMAVEAMNGALNESGRAKQNGCAITNVCLKEYLEPALTSMREFLKGGG